MIGHELRDPVAQSLLTFWFIAVLAAGATRHDPGMVACGLVALVAFLYVRKES